MDRWLKGEAVIPHLTEEDIEFIRLRAGGDEPLLTEELAEECVEATDAILTDLINGE